jgi:hypothetical protein
MVFSQGYPTPAAILQQVPPKIITYFDENKGKMIATLNPGQ